MLTSGSDFFLILLLFYCKLMHIFCKNENKKRMNYIDNQCII